MHLFGGCGRDEIFMLGLSFQRQRQPRWETQLDCQIVELCKIVLLDLLCHFSSEHLPLVFERVATFLVRHSKAGWWFGGRPEFTRGRKGKGWSGWDGGILAWPTSILTTGGRVLEANTQMKDMKNRGRQSPFKSVPPMWLTKIMIHKPRSGACFGFVVLEDFNKLWLRHGMFEKRKVSFHPWMASRLRLCRNALVFVWDLGVNPTTFTGGNSVGAEKG